MKEVSLFGIPWVIRSDAVAETQYKAENVSLYSQASPLAADGSKIFPTTRRIGLVAPNDSSACIMTRDALGWGTYEVLLAGRIDWLDPEVWVAAWTHPDTERPPGFVEADIEAGSGGDQNKRNNRLMLGVYVDAKKPMVKRLDGSEVQKYPDALYGVPSYRYHKWTIIHTPSRVVCECRGWWDPHQMWKDYAWGAWDLPSPVMGRFKVGVWRKRPNMYPASASGPSRIVLAGFKFTPLGG